MFKLGKMDLVLKQILHKTMVQAVFQYIVSWEP